MTEELKPPKRRNQLSLSIHADSLEQLVCALEDVLGEISDSGNNSTIGGPRWGGHWEHVVNKDQTPAKYHDQLKAYIADLRRCCERDTDGDGNCHVHSSKGVLR